MFHITCHFTILNFSDLDKLIRDDRVQETIKISDLHSQTTYRHDFYDESEDPKKKKLRSELPIHIRRFEIAMEDLSSQDLTEKERMDGETKLSAILNSIIISLHELPQFPYEKLENADMHKKLLFGLENFGYSIEIYQKMLNILSQYYLVNGKGFRILLDTNFVDTIMNLFLNGCDPSLSADVFYGLAQFLHSDVDESIRQRLYSSNCIDLILNFYYPNINDGNIQNFFYLIKCLMKFSKGYYDYCVNLLPILVDYCIPEGISIGRYVYQSLRHFISNNPQAVETVRDNCLEMVLNFVYDGSPLFILFKSVLHFLRVIAEMDIETAQQIVNVQFLNSIRQYFDLKAFRFLEIETMLFDFRKIILLSPDFFSIFQESSLIQEYLEGIKSDSFMIFIECACLFIQFIINGSSFTINAILKLGILECFEKLLLYDDDAVRTLSIRALGTIVEYLRESSNQQYYDEYASMEWLPDLMSELAQDECEKVSSLAQKFINDFIETNVETHQEDIL